MTSFSSFPCLFVAQEPVCPPRIVARRPVPWPVPVAVPHGQPAFVVGLDDMNVIPFFLGRNTLQTLQSIVSTVTGSASWYWMAFLAEAFISCKSASASLPRFAR